MSTTLRVKVRVSDLIANAEKQKAELERQYERDLAKYDREQVHLRDRMYRALVAAADGILDGGELPQVHSPYYGSGKPFIEVPLRGKVPRKPSKPSSCIDQDLKLLRACADETLVITATHDFYRYI